MLACRPYLRELDMGKKDPRVDAYIEKSADFARPILKHLRALVHLACPDVEETWKWSFPFFMYKGMLCHMAAFKAHCTFGFWHREVRESIGDGKSADAMGQLGRITKREDLPKDAVLKQYIKQAMALNEQGIKSPKASVEPKAPVKMPANMKAALQGNPKARANFEKFSPSQQREYIEWIAEAKREETAAKRIATMLEWVARGKSRNWKYETPRKK